VHVLHLLQEDQSSILALAFCLVVKGGQSFWRS
jgi:hypothetical protein